MALTWEDLGKETGLVRRLVRDLVMKDCHSSVLCPASRTPESGSEGRTLATHCFPLGASKILLKN